MNKQFTIGVLIGNANSPHTLNMMQGMYNSCKQAGFNLIFFLGVHSSYYHRSRFGETSDTDFDYQSNIVYDYSRLTQADALIIAYGSLSIFLGETDLLTFLSSLPKVPYVLLEETDPTGKGTSIITDNFKGMYEIAEHLVKDHGYKNITYLSGPMRNTDAAQRLNAVKSIMEKYQIPFDESHIEYGNFSECAEQPINSLLDRFPTMEAMICANDVMANTAYQEIQKRGLTVGTDIAVTGFDDWEVADSMNPPLTTVHQNSYNMGCLAVEEIWKLFSGNTPHSVILPTSVHYRNSCGCSKATPDFQFPSNLFSLPAVQHQKSATECILNYILLANICPDARKTLYEKLIFLFQYDLKNPAQQSKILSCIASLLKDANSSYISKRHLLTALREYIEQLSISLIKQQEINAIYTLMELKTRIHELILSDLIKTTHDVYSTYQQETWFMPLISKDMLISLENERLFYESSMKKLFSLGARRSFLFLFDQPIQHTMKDVWKKPQKMYLAACHDHAKVSSFEPENRPVLTEEHGLKVFFENDEFYSMNLFCIFSGEMQYGFFAAEIPPSKMALFYLISIQIGNSLRNFYISRQQQETHLHLQMLLHEIHEKNELLNFISGRDTLTGCLNRRGFLEEAMKMNHEHSGKQACMVFADLDHLKEINDHFGHKEGDFAIQHFVEVLIEIVMTSNMTGIVGRLGGDEFTAMIILSPDILPDKLISSFKELCNKFNEASQKPYYVEASIGYECFICNDELSITEILDCADKVLYNNKSNRRNSVIK